MKVKYLYLLFDGRYRTDEDRAVCFELCETLKEAKQNAPSYGTDTVIVRCEEGPNSVLINSTILN